MPRINKPLIGALAACSILISALPSLAALKGARDLGVRLDGLDVRARAIEASVRSQTESLAAAVGESASALGRAIAAEASSSRADARARADRASALRSRSEARNVDLLSEISRGVEGLGRRREPRVLGDVLIEEGGRGAERLSQDLPLARAYEEAELAYDEGRYAAAASRYVALSEAVPGDRSIRRKLAIALFRANPADSSSYGFIRDTLGAGEAGDDEALEVLASLSVERQDWPEALGYYDRLVERRPGDPRILKEAGDCALYAGSVEKAISYLHRACSVDSLEGGPADVLAQARSSASEGASAPALEAAE